MMPVEERTIPLLHLVREKDPGLKIAAPPQHPFESFCHTPFGDGHITMSYYQNEADQIICGLSFCSPNDQFCRKIGREKAKFRRTHEGAWNGYRFQFTRNREMRFGEQLRLELWNFLKQLVLSSNYTPYAGDYKTDEERGKSIPRWVMDELRIRQFDHHNSEKSFLKGE
jgi:hypothetical protein